MARLAGRGHTSGAPARCLRHPGYWAAARRCNTTPRRPPAQLELLRASRPAQSIIADPDTAEALRERLLLAEVIVEFARSELGLDAGNSYRRYVELDDPFVVWNLFAAPPLSLEGHRWCYPFVGCVPYRGFFDRRAAIRAEARLVRRGYETHVAGVAAYSTLGWFDDPLLSTFIDWSEPRLADLLLHEIAHLRVWTRDDAAFNESFAAFAGETGASLWFRQTGREAEFDRYLGSRQGWAAPSGVAVGDQGATGIRLPERGRRRATISGEGPGARDIPALLQPPQAIAGRRGFDGVVGAVNNAYLVALGAYADWYPAFAALHRQAGGWTAFLEAVDALAGLAREERIAALEGIEPEAPRQGWRIRPAAMPGTLVPVTFPWPDPGEWPPGPRRLPVHVGQRGVQSVSSVCHRQRCPYEYCRMRTFVRESRKRKSWGASRLEQSGEYSIQAPRERVWAALNDPAVLRQCIQGCQRFEAIGDDRYATQIKAKVGPLSATFKGPFPSSTSRLPRAMAWSSPSTAAQRASARARHP